MAESGLGRVPKWRSSEGRLDRLVVFATVGGEPVPMGELTFEGRARRQSVFRYARSWLGRVGRYEISPVLPLRAKATQSTPYEVPLPFWDAAPDGWGKSVLTQAFPNQVFGMAEFLAASGDDRTGELRFGPDPAFGPARWMPPGEALVDLPSDGDTLETLQEAAEAVDAGRPKAHHLHLLVRSSADIGGARPKASIRRGDEYWIAKFRATGDAFDNPRAEALCLAIAGECGIEIPDNELVEVAGRSVLLVRRFDRIAGGGRLGYMSAATLLGHEPYAHKTDATYPDVAAKAREIGVRPCEADLFRRMIFNCFVHNTDDHLRNHAFIREDGQWRLSPGFDIVVNHTPRLVLRPGHGIDPKPDPAMAFSAHPQFRLTAERAADIYDGVVEGLRRLPEMFDRFAVSARDRDVLKSLMAAALSPPAIGKQVAACLPPVRPRGVCTAAPTPHPPRSRPRGGSGGEIFSS